MKADFWHERWEKGEIGFHQQDFNRHMQAFVDRLEYRARRPYPGSALRQEPRHVVAGPAGLPGHRYRNQRTGGKGFFH